MMKKRISDILFFLICGCSMTFGQNSTSQRRTLTEFDTFQPATVTMKDGRTMKIALANISLKNAHLLYKKGTTDMQANMEQIKAVDINKRHYERVDTVLAYVIDSVGDDKLLCSPLLDMEAFRNQRANNREISHLEIGDMVTVTTANLQAEEDVTYPVTNHYFFRIGGKAVKAAERPCTQLIPKDKRRIYKDLLGSGSFGWGNPESLMQILRLITSVRKQ